MCALHARPSFSLKLPGGLRGKTTHELPFFLLVRLLDLNPISMIDHVDHRFQRHGVVAWSRRVVLPPTTLLSTAALRNCSRTVVWTLGVGTSVLDDINLGLFGILVCA